MKVIPDKSNLLLLKNLIKPSQSQAVNTSGQSNFKAQIQALSLIRSVSSSSVADRALFNFSADKKDIYHGYIDKLYDKITQKDANILLTTHSGPDGDGLAATIVLANIIKTINPEAKITLISPDPVKSDRYNALKTPQEKGLLSYTDYKTSTSENLTALKNTENLVTITADVPNISLFANPELESIIKNSDSVLQIDEHGFGSQELYSGDNLDYLHDPEAVSSSHIVLKIAQQLQKKSEQPLLNPDLLKFIYYGASHDNQFVARGESAQPGNSKHQTMLALRQELDPKSENLDAVDSNIYKIMTEPSTKEQDILAYIANCDATADLIRFPETDTRIVINKITQDDIDSLNMKDQAKLGSDYDRDNRYHWTNVKGIMPHLAKQNSDKADIQILVTETDAKLSAEGQKKFKIGLRVNDGGNSNANVAQLAKEIPEQVDLKQKAGGHTSAAGAYYLANSVDQVISRLVNVLSESVHKL